MNDIAYINRWEMINKNFNSWFNGESWPQQKKYLGKTMSKEFNILNINIKKIFATFDEIYPDKGPIIFNWEDYQFPTLVAITSNYVKNLL